MSTGDEAAFPQSIPEDPCQPAWAENPVSRGLTKREYTAIAAMNGMLARNNTHPAEKGLAERAMKYADALLAELAK